jgi:hypothetical protein
VLQARGITVDEAALALSALKPLAALKMRDFAAQTLQRLAVSHGVTSVAAAFSYQ